MPSYEYKATEAHPHTLPEEASEIFNEPTNEHVYSF
jgi:hypothetical protein